MTMHRRYHIALLLAAAAHSLAAQDTPRKWGAAAREGERAGQQNIDARYAVASDVSVRLKGSVGTLRVIGWNRDSLVITGTLPKGMRFESSVGGNGTGPARGAKMYVESPNDELASGSVLELRVPMRARVWVASGTANVEATDIAGGLDINVIGGSVRVVSSPRELQVEAMDASVVVEGSPAWLRVKTATGDITLRGSSSDAALTTVSGTVRLAGGSLERARIETVTGAISFAADFAKGADVTFDSHSGPIDLAISPKANFDLNATSLTGNVVNQYDATRPTPGREGRGKNVVVSQGWETVRVMARTFKGTITVKRR